MMYKILILTLMIVNPFNFDYAYANTKDILVLYEQAYNVEKGYNSIEAIKDQLSSYSVNIDNVQIDSYKQDTINKYDYIFVINVENTIQNTDVIKDLVYTNRDIYWIGNGVQNLTDSTTKYSIEYTNKDSLINKVINNKTTKIVDDNEMYNIVNVTNNKAKVIASMTDGYNEYPYMIKDRNLLYTVDSDIKDNTIFLDSLNDYLKLDKGNSTPSEPNLEKEEKPEISSEQLLFEQRMKTINNVVVMFIMVIIVVFSMIYFKFRKINKNKFKID
ncbi:MAG: hypothetical protein ACRDA3_02120, partial [Peptostreptococcaceae bacterium]